MVVNCRLTHLAHDDFRVATKYPKWFLERLKAVTAKRAKTVIDHILKHGRVTTEDLKTRYGYDHPPRAAGDVREQGIPLETFRIADSQGKEFAVYRFADPGDARHGVLAGRRVFSKDFKRLLAERDGSRCGICLTEYEARYLQVDHKVPYEVGGEGGGESTPEGFQLLCGSCNRAKSWLCERCNNWIDDRQPRVCRSCYYWANPENYGHVALLLIRRIDVTWTGDETREYDQLADASCRDREHLHEYIKGVLRKSLGQGK